MNKKKHCTYSTCTKLEEKKYKACIFLFLALSYGKTTKMIWESKKFILGVHNKAFMPSSKLHEIGSTYLVHVKLSSRVGILE